jgi:hypothetical protein
MELQNNDNMAPSRSSSAWSSEGRSVGSGGALPNRLQCLRLAGLSDELATAAVRHIIAVVEPGTIVEVAEVRNP